MKIESIKAAVVRLPDRGTSTTRPRRPSWGENTAVAAPMSRYPALKAHLSPWLPPGGLVACIATAEDGTWGLGMTSYGSPVVSIINDHYATMLRGQDCLATEKIWDVMFRLSAAHSASGIASYAISAVDLALWDLKGKLLRRPVYELLGGPAKERILCYATGNDTDWHMELGFRATKLACLYGPAGGLDALEKNEEMVSDARQLIGPGIDLMLDCWMSLDVEFAVRLAERLRPYGLRWIEDCLIPEDFRGFAELRRRVPWQTMATGEHWYTPLPFFQAAADQVVDILQPDVKWVGGLTALVKICHIAEAAGISVIPHDGMGDCYGQHAVYAMPNIPMGEFGMITPPGVPLTEASQRTPGMSLPKNGCLVPSDATGFGIEWTREELESAAI